MSKMASRPLAVAAASAVLTLGAFAVPAPASAHWSCGRAAPADIDTSGGHETNGVAPLRVGSSTRCAETSTSVIGSAGVALDYHCYAVDINRREVWTYVVVVGGSKRGWISQDHVHDGGSHVRCAGDT